MEFFIKAKAVRLKSHLGKFLIADEDEETVRQSRNRSSIRAKWVIEFDEENKNIIRLRSCYGKYLCATDKPYLLGMTGKKVSQIESNKNTNLDSYLINWVPTRDGFQVKLRTKDGKYLRGNGGTIPWRNSVTHDIPYATKDWILWDVDMVDLSESDLHCFGDYQSQISSLSSSLSEQDLFDSPMSPRSIMMASPRYPSKVQLGMELFQNAKTIRLRSHHDKYLIAEDDEESVSQDRNGSSKSAKWTIEFIQNASTLRFKSCYGKYLTATNFPLFLGMTGKKVLQTLPTKLLDSTSIQWEPIREGFQVKLKTRVGNFLRANGGLPPWRNSITHDIPHRSSTQDWVLWDVDILEIQVQSLPPSLKEHDHHHQNQTQTHSLPSQSTLESSDSFVSSTSSIKVEGRIIYYSIADENGNADEGFEEGSYFSFKGKGVDELTQKLEEETGLEDIIVCTKSPLNGKLYPLHLQLPPNNSTMHVVAVQSSSKVAKEFLKPGLEKPTTLVV